MVEDYQRNLTFEPSTHGARWQGRPLVEYEAHRALNEALAAVDVNTVQKVRIVVTGELNGED